MRTIYLDIETTTFFDDPKIAVLPRWQQLAALPWGLAVTCDDRGEWLEWDRHEAQTLWNYLMGMDRQIVTWNGDEFDVPYVAVQALIGGYRGVPHTDPVNSLDLMGLIRRESKALDGKERWYKLDVIAHANLGRGKIGDGRQAAAWLSSGDPEQRRLAMNYCQDDVQILIDLHAQLLAGEPLICPARPERREYKELRIGLR